MLRVERRLEQRELAAVALRACAGRRRMRLGAVVLRLEVAAAREDHPVERFERLVDPVLVRWHEHARPPARSTARTYAYGTSAASVSQWPQEAGST